MSASRFLDRIRELLTFMRAKKRGTVTVLRKENVSRALTFYFRRTVGVTRFLALEL